MEDIRISAQAGFRKFRISRCKCNVDKALPRQQRRCTGAVALQAIALLASVAHSEQGFIMVIVDLARFTSSMMVQTATNHS
jgi:hypothetical protein